MEIKILNETLYTTPKQGGSITGNLVTIIGERLVEAEGKIIEQYLYNIDGYTAKNGKPFASLKANIMVF